ncbi:Deoxyribonuclease-2-beta, partial [Trichinella sp. T9]
LNVKMPLGKKHFITNLKWILFLWTYLCNRSLATSKCQNSDGTNAADWAILYKAPAQPNGAAGNWANNPVAVTQNNGHSFAKAIEHVFAPHVDNKFIAYNNDPPDVPKVRTKSNSKGNTDAAAWIVHTVPGFPKARTGYLFPPAEVQKGHLLICLTIKEDQIDTIESLNVKMPLGKKHFITNLKWILFLWAYLCNRSLATSTCGNLNGANAADWAILYKAPAQRNGAAGGNWENSPAEVTANNGHSFAKALEHVIGADANNKFISYNNHPPDVPKIKTKSNSKGVLMMDTRDTDAAAWIVHTVPGFPKARTGYLFPPAEVQKGHLLICLTIKEDQIDTIAMTLRIATPLIYYNDIPDAQMDSRPNLKKLANGVSRLTPPLTVTQDTTTTGAQSLKVTIYSKGEKSRYEIYRRVLVRKLKTSIKVWTTRDKFLKSDCKTFGRNLKLVTSPISVDGHASSLENDVSQWIVSEPGNKFCVVDKPYHKSQAKEPAMAVCIDDATIFGHFNRIAQNVENCA